MQEGVLAGVLQGLSTRCIDRMCVTGCITGCVEGMCNLLGLVAWLSRRTDPLALSK